MRYFVQLASELDRFDEVDEFVFANRHAAVIGDTPRYADGYVTINEGEVDINGTFAASVLVNLPRMLGLGTAAQPPKSFYDEPDTVVMLKGKGVILYNLKDKSVWKKAA